jgi:hypothetical protein
VVSASKPARNRRRRAPNRRIKAAHGIVAAQLRPLLQRPRLPHRVLSRRRKPIAQRRTRTMRWPRDLRLQRVQPVQPVVVDAAESSLSLAAFTCPGLRPGVFFAGYLRAGMPAKNRSTMARNSAGCSSLG